MGRSPANRVPLRAIAEQAGVSRMTVSLALRDSPSISKETGRRVQEIAFQLGYRPDPVVSDLMAGLRIATRAQNAVTIGVITDYHGGQSWRDCATQRAYFAGMAEKAAALGYTLDEFRLHHEGMSERRIIQIMEARGIEGAVFFPRFDGAGWAGLQPGLARFSCAAIGCSPGGPALHQVCTHYFNAAMEAGRQLRALGYRRIGLVLSEEEDRRSGHQWCAGFLTHEHLHPADDAVPILIRPDASCVVFASWMRAHRPDAILHATSVERIAGWLERLELRAPDDVGHACLELNSVHSGASGVDENSKLVGAAAIERVAAGIGRQERGEPAHPATVMINGVWRSGNTTRCQGGRIPFVTRSMPSGHPKRPGARRARGGANPILFEPTLEHKPLRAS